MDEELTHQSEDLNSDPQDPCEAGHGVTHHQFQCVCGGMEGRDRRISQKLGLTSLASTVAKNRPWVQLGGRLD